ncbi:MAG: hypothetical protein JO100_18305 [Pseudonocardia sp.]|nr:hypothetical protein [Pseudonocardia sp.]
MTRSIVQAGIVSYFGPAGTLVLLGFAGLAMTLMVIGVNAWLRWQRGRVRPPDHEANTVEATPAYRRFLVAAAWAGGSARDWDYSVRPVLAELVELAVAEQEPSAGDPRAVARERLGEPLWALVDRDVRRSDDRSVPGAGRDALLRILDRVENT